MQPIRRGQMKRAVFQMLDLTPASWKEKTKSTEAAITNIDPTKLLRIYQDLCFIDDVGHQGFDSLKFFD